MAATENIPRIRLIFIGIIVFLNACIITSLPGGSLAFFLPTIIKELGLTPTQATSLSAGVALGTTFTVFVLGMVMDKVSIHKLMALVTIVAAVLVAGRGLGT